MHLDLGAGFTLRPATPADLPALRRVTLLTGDAGSDATPLQDDSDLLGDFYSVPYALFEPEHAFAVEGASGVVGYVLGALDSRKFYDRVEREWLSKLRARVRDPGPDEAHWHGSDWVRRVIHYPNFALPPVLDTYPSHAHIDLLPEVQGRGIGRAAFGFLLDRLAAAGSRGIHLGVSPRNKRAQAFYRKLGFIDLVSDELPAETHFMGRQL